MESKYSTTASEKTLPNQLFQFAKTCCPRKKQFLQMVSLLVALFVFGSIGWGQAPTISWQKSLGGSSIDVAQAVQQTNDGGYIVAGQSASNNGDVSGNHGSTDYWIVKLDGSGNILWQKSFGGSSFDVAQAVQQTNDGGYIVAGESASNNGDVSGNHGSTDYWIVKLDGSGNILWQKSFGGSMRDRALAVQQTNDGGYILAGESASNNSDVSGNHGGADYWMVKLDGSGNLLWQKSFGGSSIDRALAVQQTNDGGYIVAGESASNNGDVSGNHGSTDYWIVKLDGSGNILWQKSLGGSSFDVAYSIQQTTDGGYIVAGFSSSSNGDVSGNHGGYDYWIVKLDGSGNLLWQNSFGGSSIDFPHSIQQTTDGGYIVAGFSESNNGDVSGNHGLRDYWIVKLDGSGNILWQKSLGGSGIDSPHSIQQTIDGGYIVAGVSESNNGDVSGNHGRQDYWVVKLCTDPAIWFRDNDRDGFGNPNIMHGPDCKPNNGYHWVKNNYDCDDNKNNLDKPEDNEVLMCREGKMECVKVKHVDEKQRQGWVLGPCASPCEDGMVLMCHNGSLHCVKQNDVEKHLKQGWTVGYCSATEPATTGVIVAARTEISHGEPKAQELVNKLSLSNYPNPFSKVTCITYSVPAEAKVTIKVFDLMGREVDVIFTGERAVGTYSQEYNTATLPSGVYYARMISTMKGQQYIKTQKLIKAD